MDLVCIYGPPGVGKLTVATEVARRTGYKLFHNHLSIAAIEPVFDFGTETFWRLVHSIRADVFESAAREGISLVYTCVYEHPNDLELVRNRFSLVEKHGGKPLLVKLFCERSVIEGRVENQSRRDLHKLADVGAWRAATEGRHIDSLILGRDSLVIDNTTLSPDEVATRIISHYRLPEEIYA